MKISDIKSNINGNRTRVSANVIWEDSPRPPVEVYFEVPSEFADALSIDGNAFLVAAVVPAMEAGERRIAIDGEICARLQSGLITIQRLFQSWYGGSSHLIAIDSRTSCGRSPQTHRAGVFFSGGIDSLATLRRNRLMFPPTHPDSIKDLVLLYGINFDSDDSPETFARAVEELSSVATAVDAPLIPVYTNARRDLNPDLSVFLFKYHGALLAAAAHALTGRVTAMSISSTHDVPDLMPWGSHPLVDPNYSSVAMRIHHDCLDLSRFAKTKLVADWEVGLQNIRVCTAMWPGTNCGRCEKCLRTMLALEALGALERTAAFDDGTISEETVRNITLYTKNQASFYRELIVPLQQAGRDDLARAIEFVLARYHRELGVAGQLRRFDRLHLGGALTSLTRSIRKTAATV